TRVGINYYIMKHTLISFQSLLIGTLFSLLAFFSCKQNDAVDNLGKNNNTPKARESVTIGYINDEEEFVPIENEHIVAYYQHIEHLSSSAILEDFEVREEVDNGTTHYYLYNHGIDGNDHAKIVSNLSVYNNDPTTLALAGKTCTCKSESCIEAWGCDASLTAGGSCSCSPCTGEGSKCEKTSTTSSLSA